MKRSWKKALIMAAPLVIVAGGVGYAMAGSAATERADNANQTAKTNNVTAEVVSSQLLTPEEAAQIGNAKPAPLVESTATASATTTSGSGGVDQATLDANNPFTVQSPPASTGTAQDPAATPALASNFQVSLVKGMELETNTTEGKLKAEFKQEKGSYRLTGELAGRKLDVRGDQAVQIMNQLLSGFQLSDALTSVLQGRSVHLDPSVLGAMEHLKVELQDGRKIESKGTPPHGPKAEGKHDNGQHNGADKGRDKGKEKKHED